MGTRAGPGARLWGCLMAQREDRTQLAWGLPASASLSASSLWQHLAFSLYFRSKAAIPALE